MAEIYFCKCIIHRTEKIIKMFIFSHHLKQWKVFSDLLKNFMSLHWMNTAYLANTFLVTYFIVFYEKYIIQLEILSDHSLVEVLILSDVMEMISLKKVFNVS